MYKTITIYRKLSIPRFFFRYYFASLILNILIIFGLYYINTFPDLFKKASKLGIIQGLVSSLVLGLFILAILFGSDLIILLYSLILIPLDIALLVFTYKFKIKKLVETHNKRMNSLHSRLILPNDRVYSIEEYKLYDNIIKNSLKNN